MGQAGAQAHIGLGMQEVVVGAGLDAEQQVENGAAGGRLAGLVGADDEMEIARTQIRASTILGSDDPENRMQSIGINEIVWTNVAAIS